MVIDKLLVKNFRSIEDEVLICCDLTALVGRNGSGKSSFLRALDLFYSLTPKVDSEDFYNRDISREIVVSITYKNLNEEATALFSKYLQGGLLTIERVIAMKEGKISCLYHGSVLQHPEFSPVREAFNLKDNAKTAKTLYSQLRQDARFSALPEASAKGAMSDGLQKWEESNQVLCERSRDDGQFFGFKSVASGYLGKFTRFLFIPAIRDASQDASDNASSPISELMDLVVRSVMANKTELVELREATQNKFSDLMGPSKLTELDALAGQMTATLKRFVPDAGIKMSWQPLPDVQLPIPKADTKLSQDGYDSPVGKAGHGLQRAFIITALQHLVLAQHSSPLSNEGKATHLPVLVLAIEEPELYQHPNSQRHLAKIILELAQGKTPGVAEKTQIIYGTHSPHFVGLDRIDQVRLLKKRFCTDQSQPKITSIIQTSLKDIAKKVWLVNGSNGSEYTETTLLPRLHSIMSPALNEGFFADVAVLVEGEGDVAAIQAVAHILGHDLPSLGISIIPCNGKNSIDRPATIFSEFGIPTYVVWDSDKGKDGAKKEENHTMLRLVGEKVLDDFPPTQVKEKFACFGVKLEVTLREEIGSNYDTYLQRVKTNFAMSKDDHAMKNPRAISEILRFAKENNENSPTLEAIVQKILALKSGS